MARGTSSSTAPPLRISCPFALVFAGRSRVVGTQDFTRLHQDHHRLRHTLRKSVRLVDSVNMRSDPKGRGYTRGRVGGATQRREGGGLTRGRVLCVLWEQRGSSEQALRLRGESGCGEFECECGGWDVEDCQGMSGHVDLSAEISKLIPRVSGSTTTPTYASDSRLRRHLPAFDTRYVNLVVGGQKGTSQRNDAARGWVIRLATSYAPRAW